MCLYISKKLLADSVSPIQRVDLTLSNCARGRVPLRRRGRTGMSTIHKSTFGRREVTFEQATQAAEEILRMCGRVRCVELFGSIALRGVGGDFDFILITDEATSRTFLQVMNEEDADAYGEYVTAKYRFLRASLLMPILDIVSAWAYKKFNGEYLDVFLFPPDWRCRIGEIQGYLKTSDPNFVMNLAREARHLASRD